MTVIDNQKKETEETNLLDYVGWLPENDPPPRSSRNLSIIMKHSRFYFSVSVCIIATIMFYLERGTWDEGQARFASHMENPIASKQYEEPGSGDLLRSLLSTQ